MLQSFSQTKISTPWTIKLCCIVVYWNTVPSSTRPGLPSGGPCHPCIVTWKVLLGKFSFTIETCLFYHLWWWKTVHCWSSCATCGNRATSMSPAIMITREQALKEHYNILASRGQKIPHKKLTGSHSTFVMVNCKPCSTWFTVLILAIALKQIKVMEAQYSY